jgi:hypothetical protein
MECNTTEFIADPGSLYDYFTKMEDTRKKRGSGIRYRLPTLILLIVLVKFMWGRQAIWNSRLGASSRRDAFSGIAVEVSSVAAL